MLFWLQAVKVHALGCINYQGEEVDWFLVFKPNSDTTAVYTDPNQQEMGYVQPLDSMDNPVIATIAPLYEDESKYQAMFWNDELEGVDPEDYGVAKGILAMDPATNQGFFMHHITPDWPALPSQGLVYNNPDYGHHYLCVSVNLTQLEDIAEYLLPLKPLVYYNSFTAEYVVNDAPSLVVMFFEDTDIAEVTSTITSQAGNQFIFYSKGHYVGGLWQILQGATQQNMYSVAWTAYEQYLGKANILETVYDENAEVRFPDLEEQYRKYVANITVSNERRRLLREMEEELQTKKEAGEDTTEYLAKSKAQIEETIQSLAKKEQEKLTQPQEASEPEQQQEKKEELVEEKKPETAEPEKPEEAKEAGKTEEPSQAEEKKENAASVAPEAVAEEQERALFIQNAEGELEFSDSWPEIMYHTHVAMTDDAVTVCFGDVNHMARFKRVKSGAICVKNEGLVRQLISYAWATEQDTYETEDAQEVEEQQEIVQTPQEQVRRQKKDKRTPKEPSK